MANLIEAAALRSRASWDAAGFFFLDVAPKVLISFSANACNLEAMLKNIDFFAFGRTWSNYNAQTARSFSLSRLNPVHYLMTLRCGYRVSLISFAWNPGDPVTSGLSIATAWRSPKVNAAFVITPNGCRRS
jgi:hypothetical protein